MSRIDRKGWYDTLVTIAGAASIPVAAYYVGRLTVDMARTLIERISEWIEDASDEIAVLQERLSAAIKRKADLEEAARQVADDVEDEDAKSALLALAAKSDGRALERKAGLPLLKAWLMARAERKSFRMSNGDTAVTSDEIIKYAEMDFRDYLQIAERGPERNDLEGLIAEMRRAITEDNLGQLEEEGTIVVNDYDGSAITEFERGALQAKLNAMADDCEARIRAVAMSLFDRIGAPKGDRRRIAAKRTERPAPGAHRAYSGR